MLLDGRPYTIVGIMPPAFESPLQGGVIDIFLNGDRGVPRSFPFSGDLTAVREGSDRIDAGEAGWSGNC